MVDNAEEIAYLQGQRSQYQSEMTQASADKAAIEEKLQRLETAKKEVDEIQQVVKILKKAVIDKNNPESWLGQKKDEYMSKMEVFDTDLETYYKGIDNLYDHICDEITKLENEKSDLTGIIGWCQKTLNNIGNSLEKLFHF